MNSVVGPIFNKNFAEKRFVGPVNSALDLGLDANARCVCYPKRLMFFCGSCLVHYSWDSQVWNSANFKLKLRFIVLFIYLKIILLHW